MKTTNERTVRGKSSLEVFNETPCQEGGKNKVRNKHVKTTSRGISEQEVIYFIRRSRFEFLPDETASLLEISNGDRATFVEYALIQIIFI